MFWCRYLELCPEGADWTRLSLPLPGRKERNTKDAQTRAAYSEATQSAAHMPLAACFSSDDTKLADLRTASTAR